MTLEYIINKIKALGTTEINDISYLNYDDVIYVLEHMEEIFVTEKAIRHINKDKIKE